MNTRKNPREGKGRTEKTMEYPTSRSRRNGCRRSNHREMRRMDEEGIVLQLQ